MSKDESVDVITILVEILMLVVFVMCVWYVILAIQTGEMFFGVDEGQTPPTLATDPVGFWMGFVFSFIGALGFWWAGVLPLAQRVRTWLVR